MRSAPEPAKSRGLTLRSALVIAHRWAGLVIALVLIVAGATGALLPFAKQLNHLAAPKLWAAAPPHPGDKPLSGLQLMRLVETQTGGSVTYMPLELDPRFAQAVFVGRTPGGPKLAFSEVIADPYTGAIRQKVVYGRLADGPVNWLPFLVDLHYSLAAGPWGAWAFGVAALVWVFLSLVGFYLTFPIRGLSPRDWLRRWGQSWKIRTKGGSQPFTFDLHRAGGLWLWPLMLVFAWSGVAFNLPKAHDPVNRWFGGRGLYAAPRNVDPAAGPPMALEAAVARGHALMDAQAGKLGFTVERGYALSISRSARAYGYYARTSLDRPVEAQGSTVVWFDAASGRLLSFMPPFGKTAADRFDKWVRVLHTADVFGLPYRIFVSAFGALVAILAATGVLLWTQRQTRRLLGRG